MKHLRILNKCWQTIFTWYATATVLMGFWRIGCDIGEQLLIGSGGGDVCGVVNGDSVPLHGESTNAP